MTMIRTSTLAGVPIHYDRLTPGDYGGEGAPIRPRMDEGFYNQCEDCFANIAAAFQDRFGALDLIVTGGVSRAGAGASLHHKNRAFDLDGLYFSQTHWIADTFPQRPHFYLAIEAVLRRYFGTVLAFDYNRAHEDHFHFDNGRSPGFSSMSKSRVTFLQNAAHFIFDLPIGRDGVYGPETEDAARQLRGELDIGTFSQKENWFAFLEKTCEHALSRAT